MDTAKIEQGIKLILAGIGEDPNRPGLIETPQRIVHLYEELFSGINQDPLSILKSIEGESHDEIVLAKDIPMYSICEHHLLPFQGVAHIAYIPKDGCIVGLSKLVRVLEILSRRPQLQERLTSQLADILMEGLRPRGVLVIVKALHLCMTIRGVKKPGSEIVTSAVRGLFRTSEPTRSEALALINI
ncbi:MAG: GTP cyclohydrolase I FolE [Candidatus Schekmanbacteria bacterium]|nr:GTP cyclohydrolase I FolE [Candidatus Schekmanbacteria bacterium]